MSHQPTVINASGTHREVGRQIGEAARDLVAQRPRRVRGALPAARGLQLLGGRRALARVRAARGRLRPAGRRPDPRARGGRGRTVPAPLRPELQRGVHLRCRPRVAAARALHVVRGHGRRARRLRPQRGLVPRGCGAARHPQGPADRRRGVERHLLPQRRRRVRPADHGHHLAGLHLRRQHGLLPRRARRRAQQLPAHGRAAAARPRARPRPHRRLSEGARLEPPAV